jgi:hypothetical protein
MSTKQITLPSLESAAPEELSLAVRFADLMPYPTQDPADYRHGKRVMLALIRHLRPRRIESAEDAFAALHRATAAIVDAVEYVGPQADRLVEVGDKLGDVIDRLNRQIEAGEEPERFCEFTGG